MDKLYESNENINKHFDINYECLCNFTDKFEFGEKDIKYKYTPCAFAISHGNIALLEYLEKHNNIDLKKEIKGNTDEEVREYFKYGEDNYGELSYYGEGDSYHIAATHGHINIMKYLEDKHNWDICSFSYLEYSVYITAIYAKQLDILKYLEINHLDKMAECHNDECEYNCSDLVVISIKNNSLDILKFLCNESRLIGNNYLYRINVDDGNKYKNLKYCLSNAIQWGNYEIIDYINKIYEERGGKTMFYDLAIFNKKPKVLEFYHNKYPDKTIEFFMQDSDTEYDNMYFNAIRICKGDVNTLLQIEKVLKRNNSLQDCLKHISKKGYNIYHVACRYGILDYVKYLDKEYKDIIDPIRKVETFGEGCN